MLYKQKHSYESRLRLRQNKEKNYERLDQLDRIIELVTREALASMADTEARHSLSTALIAYKK